MIGTHMTSIHNFGFHFKTKIMSIYQLTTFIAYLNVASLRQKKTTGISYFIIPVKSIILNGIIYFSLTCFLNFHINAQKQQSKVVMISLDGTPDYLVDKFLKNGVFPPNGAFARMKKKVHMLRGFYLQMLLQLDLHIFLFSQEHLQGKQESLEMLFGSQIKTGVVPHYRLFDNHFLLKQFFKLQ